jgi:hypothetical protein
MSSVNSPQVGMQVEMLRSNELGSSFESAVVVDRLIDPVIGLVLELQFGDARRIQRVWPSPAIRLVR